MRPAFGGAVIVKAPDAVAAGAQPPLVVIV